MDNLDERTLTALHVNQLDFYPERRVPLNIFITTIMHLISRMIVGDELRIYAKLRLYQDLLQRILTLFYWWKLPA